MAVSSLLHLLLLLLLLQLIQGQGPTTKINLQLYEQVQPDQFVGDILAKAVETNLIGEADKGNVQFSLLNQGASVSVDNFKLVGDGNKDLRTRTVIDRDAQDMCPQMVNCVVSLNVGAYNSDTNFQKVIRVDVDIMDQNDQAPQFLQAAIHKSIPESAAVGTTIDLPTAEDLDSPDNGITEYVVVQGFPQFEFQSQKDAQGDWKLNFILKQQLDRESRAFYQMVIAAKDGRGVGTLLVNVTVLDANDNPPKFSESVYPVFLPEDTKNGSIFLKVSATDFDSGINGEIIYTLEGRTQFNYGDMFNVDPATGDVALRGELDYEKLRSPELQLQVTAHDRSVETLSSTAKIVITVQDVNDNPPQIIINAPSSGGTPGRAQVSELASSGKLVAYVIVSDPDSGAGGEFTCRRLGSVPFDLTPISETQGTYTLVTQGVLDREDAAQYDVQISCTDKGSKPLSATATVRVNILDENDNAPRFSKPRYEVTRPENNEVGIYLMTAEALDADEGRNGTVVFSLHGEPEDLRMVEIDRTTGKVYARARFDFEKKENISLKIEARDDGPTPQSSLADLVIRVTDLNDEAPRFINTPYELKVRENNENVSVIGQVSASDKDSDKFNKFTFKLISSTPNGEHFTVDSKTGIIFSKSPVDRELSSRYTLLIEAVDSENTNLRNSEHVIVNIMDENDNTPFVTFPNSTFNTINISNKLPVGYIFTKVVAVDLDVGDNGRLTYKIQSGNARDLFHVNESGAVYVVKALDSIDIKEFNLNIRVSDNGNPQRSVDTMIRIVVDGSIPFLARDDDREEMIVGPNLTIVIVVALLSAILIVVLSIVIAILVRKDKMKKKRRNLATMLSHQRVYMADGDHVPTTDILTAETGSVGRDNSAYTGQHMQKPSPGPAQPGLPQSSLPLDPMEWTRHYLYYDRQPPVGGKRPPQEECESVRSATSNTDSGRGSNEDINSRHGSVESWAAGGRGAPPSPAKNPHSTGMAPHSPHASQGAGSPPLTRGHPQEAPPELLRKSYRPQPGHHDNHTSRDQQQQQQQQHHHHHHHHPHHHSNLPHQSNSAYAHLPPKRDLNSNSDSNSFSAHGGSRTADPSPYALPKKITRQISGASTTNESVQFHDGILGNSSNV